MGSLIISESDYQYALKSLLSLYESLKAHNDKEIQFMVSAKDEVQLRYQPVFDADNLDELSKEDLISFLQIKNNKHWSGLDRRQKLLTSNMNSLRKALRILLDESRSISDRLKDISPSGSSAAPGLGKAIMTALLVVMFPLKYGVWNGTSEAAMKKLNIFPGFETREDFGIRYTKVNDILIRLTTDLNIDFWLLDFLWWKVLKEEPNTSDLEEEISEADDHRFGIERHLQDFITDNWERISALNGWNIYEVDGDPSIEYKTDVGRIDILAVDKNQNWLVIELKRGQTSDQTIGQVLRYMGWVKSNLSGTNNSVQGLIIAREVDEPFKLALSCTQDIRYMTYKINFQLEEPENANNPRK
ncbi:MAG: DUF91 domain-containing protein [Chloroflexi bacterium]|nr:DUF91 domain-containing protein [Chloroflexota bacterium]